MIEQYKIQAGKAFTQNNAANIPAARVKCLIPQPLSILEALSHFIMAIVHHFHCIFWRSTSTIPSGLFVRHAPRVKSGMSQALDR